jgi:hypothetical protein
MSLCAERLKQLRWMAVPIAAYLVVTLALPAANGAAASGAFLRHAGWVVAGCAAIVAFALAVSVAFSLVARVALGARAANRRHARRVLWTGGLS